MQESEARWRMTEKEASMHIVLLLKLEEGE